MSLACLSFRRPVQWLRYCPELDFIKSWLTILPYIWALFHNFKKSKFRPRFKPWLSHNFHHVYYCKIKGKTWDKGAPRFRHFCYCGMEWTVDNNFMKSTSGRLFMNSLDQQYKAPIFVQGTKTTMLGIEGWIRIEVRPIFSLSSLLLSPFCQPYSHLIYSPCFTLQKALSSPFPHCSFHLSVNPIFNLSTVLVSPSSKPNLHPFLITPFTFQSTLCSTFLVPVSPSSKPTLQPFFNFFFHLLANQNLYLLSIGPFTL